jgi:predicted ferric reductase
MKLTPGLTDARPTPAQLAIITSWYLLIVGVAGLWVFGSSQLLFEGLPDALLSIGRLLGLLATFFALTQFMLMGRIAWIERSFGLDRLAVFHRINGYLAITLILLHPAFIIASYSILSGQNYIAQYLSTVQDTPYGWFAFISQVLFIAVVASSIYIARRRMKFETWYYVHLMVYAAIVLVPFHQFVSSPELAGSTFGRYFWLSLYGFVAANILVWRFALPVINFFRFNFRVTDVVAETPTTTSVYIKADRLSRLNIKPGQFVLVRILTPKLFLQEHPFSVSLLPGDDTLRLTIRKVGDYTTEIADLKPGARVVVSGPFGRFTKEVAVTSKRLFIAGGVGITPIRTMAEEAVARGTDSVIVYASRAPEDTPLKSELDELSKSEHLKVLYVFSDVPDDFKGLKGRVDGAMIKELVPDFAERDVYICGPPPMMSALVSDLSARNLTPNQLHYERFSLHN